MDSFDTLEMLLTDASEASKPAMAKVASGTVETDETLGLLDAMKGRVEEDAMTSRIVKHASAASNVFAANAAAKISEEVTAQISTDELAVKIAALIIPHLRKEAIDTSTEVIPESVAGETPVPAVDPTNAVMNNSSMPTPPEVANLHKLTKELLAKRDLVKAETTGPSVKNTEPVKQASAGLAASQGYSPEYMEAVADYLQAAAQGTE